MPSVGGIQKVVVIDFSERFFFEPHWDLRMHEWLGKLLGRLKLNLTLSVFTSADST